MLQSVNGGPATANLNQLVDGTQQKLTAQKLYKIEMQAEINKLRNKYKQSRAEEQAKESKVPEPLKILELPQEVKEQNQYR